jgi:hypothetical protein
MERKENGSMGWPEEGQSLAIVEYKPSAVLNGGYVAIERLYE